MQSCPEKTFYGIDIFKFFMALIVVTIHTHPFEGYKIINNSSLYKTLCSIAVPYFFISFGFLMFRKSNKLSSNESLLIIKNSISRIAKLYVTWTIIYLPITIYYVVTNNIAFLRDAFFFARGLFFVGEQYYSWPLWYLLAVLYSLIAILLLLKMETKNEHILLISLLMYAFGITIDAYQQISLFSNETIQFTYSLIKKAFGSGRLFTGMLYILIGIFFATYKIKVNKFISFLIIILCVFLTAKLGVFFVDLFKIITVTAIFTFSYSMNLPESNFWYFLRKSSTIIYFTHMLFFFLYTLFFKEFPYYGVDAFFVSFICTMLLSSYLLLKPKRKIIRFLFS